MHPKLKAYLRRQKLDLPKGYIGFSELDLSKNNSQAWVVDTRGGGIEVIQLGQGHISCPNCGKSFFHVETEPNKYKVLISCSKCSYSTHLIFPYNQDLSQFGSGEFKCGTHRNSDMAIIKDGSSLCIGCRKCDSQIVLELKPDKGIVLL